MNAHVPVPAIGATPEARLLATLPAPSQAATRTFGLRTKDVFSLWDRTCEFERRLGDRLQFLRVEDSCPIFLTDEQLGFLSAQGNAQFIAGSFRYGKPRGPLPHRLKLTPEQEAEADRKLDYVNACIRGFIDGDVPPRTAYEFRRSKAGLDPILMKVAAGKGETAPHFTTLLGWFDCWMALSDIHGKACLVGLHMHKGNRHKPFGHVGEVALERAVWRWLSPNMTKEMAYAKVVTTVRAYKRKLAKHMSPEELDSIKAPSLRTFQRRCKDVDKYTRDYYRKGPEYAAKMHRISRPQSLPARPYQDVEVDHCTLDILLVDDDSDIVLGRPDLIIFRCRKTGMIIGASLGYEAPSYASFVAGLRHAMYPKDMSRFPVIRNPWPCFGRIENLWIDNALHFIGSNIEAAARELKINKPRFKPKCPWLKGALERFFGYLNTGLIHMLPGTTMSNVVQRREPDPETLDRAKIRRSDFEALLMFFICDVHNVHKSKGLGLLRGIGDIPLRVWNQEAARHPSGPLPPNDLFITLCGEWEMRTIQNDGMVWGYIKYESPELISLITHPQHRNAREDGEGTRYKCVRDPEDLGRIHVIDPYGPEGRVLKIPATEAHRFYADGLHRHVHDLSVIHARRMVEGAFDFDALMTALDLLGAEAAAARGKPERKRSRKGLARFIDAERKKRFRSTVQPGPRPLPATTSGQLDPLAIASRPKAFVEADADAVAGQAKAIQVAAHDIPARTQETPLPATPPAPAEMPIPDDHDDDLADLRELKNWSTSDE